MKYKKRPKNKQEMDSFSGAKPKRAPTYEEKIKIDFCCVDAEGNEYRPPEARLKTTKEGYISFVVQTETGWKPLKAKLIDLKVKYERKLLDPRRKLPRKSS